MTLSLLPLFLIFAGYIIGLGAVTVIDTLGFFGRKSPYFTEATIRSHKITKPLIWIGMTLVIAGSYLFYTENPAAMYKMWHTAMFTILVLNGCFLSFYISPFLLKREKAGQAKKLLPGNIQAAITVSFLISFSLWWSSLLMFLKMIVG